MADREKVIKAYEDFVNGYECFCTSDDYEYEMHKAVLALLKEQEAKWIHREDMDFIDKYNCNHFHGMCTNCGLVHDFIDGHTGQYLYCPQCGRSVKWE
jgi:hypothetical protein